MHIYTLWCRCDWFLLRLLLLCFWMVQFAFSPACFLFFLLFATASLPITAIICSSCRRRRSHASQSEAAKRFGPFHYGGTCALYTIWDMGFLFLYPASPAASGGTGASDTRPVGGKKKINYTTESLQIFQQRRVFYLKPSLRFISLNTNSEWSWDGRMVGGPRSHSSVLRSSIRWWNERKKNFFIWF